MSPVFTLRVRQVAASALLVLLALAAVVALHQGSELLWHAVLEPLGTVSGGTDAGLITTPATIDGAH